MRMNWRFQVCSKVGIKNHAVSVDHLEAITQEEIDALLASNTIPTVLPVLRHF